MKTIILTLVACAAAFAQPAQTPIQDTIYDQFGRLYNGPLVVTMTATSVSSAGSPVIAVPTTIQIRNGVLSTTLAPNDTATPAQTAYIFQFGSDRKICTIPTSATPIKLSPSICTSNPPANPTPSIPLSWLGSPGTSGQAICSNGSSWVAGGCGSGGSGGGTWGSITGTLSAQTDLSSALGGKEPAISGGTAAQYWRGDKSWQTLNSGAVAESTNLYFTNARAQSAMAGLYESPLTFGAGLNRATNAITCLTATSSVFGCLTAADWATFNGKQAALGFTAENSANKDAVSGYAGLTAGSLLKASEFPALTGDCTTSAGTIAVTCGSAIAKTGADINTSNQVTATHLSAGLPRAQGGLNSTSAGTGILRDGATPTASELSGDCTTSGSNVTTCGKTGGVAFAPSATTDATNAGNITSGTLPAGRLPNPSSTTLGGVQSVVAVSNQFLDSISTAGVPHSRVIAAADVPTLNQSTTGNAATATALAATPTLCTGGQVPTGILANGNATGCAALSAPAVLSFFGNCHGTIGTATHTGTVSGLGGNPYDFNCTQAASAAYGRVVTHACALQNLYASADGAGASAGDLAVSVYVNSGSASVLTCAMGTGNSCHDTTHTVAVNAGDVVWMDLASANNGAANLRVALECK